MRAIKFNATTKSKVSNLIMKFYPMMTFVLVKKLFKNKDIKLNGKRLSNDETACEGDEICFYVQDNFFNLDIIFEDENILIVNKPRKIEVTSTQNESLEKMISSQLKIKVFAVHRLDINTTGLVIFAKNEQAKAELDKAFKLRTIEKYYYALVLGTDLSETCDLVSYLKKDDLSGKVKISDTPKAGYEKIETKYKLLKTFSNFSLVEVELLTGKTHQIRAHFAHIYHPVLGDEKYGDFNANSMMNLKYQCLCAERIVFHFEKDSPLFYLDKKEIALSQEKIDFLKYCK